MDDHYKALYKQAANMQHQFHDYSHAAAHDPAALVLRQQLHGLTNDLARGRRPQDIETRIRRIQTQIKQTQQPMPNHMPGMMPMANPMLTRVQSGQLHNNFEQMRRTIRQHPTF